MDVIATATGVACSAEALAQIMGVHRSLIYEYGRVGMPKIARGRYPLAECVQWIMGEQSGTKGSGNARGELIDEQARGHKIRNDMLRGELVSVDVFNATVLELAGIIAEVLDSVPTWAEDPGARQALVERRDAYRITVQRRIEEAASAAESASAADGSADTEC